MTEYRFATPQEMPKVIDFIDLVFSQAAGPHDFAKLIPKVYGDGHDFSAIHAIALEDGEIRGCVAMLPFDMTIAGQKLRVGYVGSVSVHRLSRGAGHMKKLMHMQIEKAKADGIDMLALGGQRQRYGYFGFSPVGGAYSYTITRSNVRHALKEVDASGFTFEPLTAENSAYAYDLYQAQPVCGSRSVDNFAEIALTFNAQGWLVKCNGSNAGYLIARNDHKGIREIVMEDESQFAAVFKAWMTAHELRSLEVGAAPYHMALNRTLSSFAEGYNLTQDGYMLCHDYASTIRSWMTLQNSLKALSEGSVHLGIADRVLHIEVADGAVNVEYSNAPADIQLTAAEADQVLFGFNRYYAPETSAAIPADWFPLPLSIPSVDTF
ncbi:MAG: GNAT family N-acetyltransferase [Clostridia bacterium]|nr:GNAT family N-acetyltransferase [Clostridia bacterium]